jgi:hypothetical protein
MLQAEQQFRRIIGYSDLAKLVIAIERRHLTAEHADTTQRYTDTASAFALATV